MNPQYRVQVFNPLADGTLGIPTSPAVEFTRIKNLGWSDYLNGVPEAFFTIDQDDEQLANVPASGQRPAMHVRILRGDDVVWAGIFATEVDSNERDVIFYNHGYLAYLAHLNTDWNVTYTNTSVGTIVSDAWTRAKTGLTYSPVKFVTTGTIQPPKTTGGVGAPDLILPTYSAYYKPILTLLQEMAVLSASDIDVIVKFEITHSATPTFNLWANYSTGMRFPSWQLGRQVEGFNVYEMSVGKVNDLLGVGSSPTSSLLRYESQNLSSMTTDGRRQGAMYLSWVRDQTELQRVVNNRRWHAEFNSFDVTLKMKPNTVIPPGATGAQFAIGGGANIDIARGNTWINNSYSGLNFIVTGVRVIWVRGQEYVRPIVQQWPGNG